MKLIVFELGRMRKEKRELQRVILEGELVVLGYEVGSEVEEDQMFRQVVSILFELGSK